MTEYISSISVSSISGYATLEDNTNKGIAFTKRMQYAKTEKCAHIGANC